MQIANINNCYIFVELMLQLSEKYGQDPSLPKIDNHRLKAVGEEFHNLASQMYVPKFIDAPDMPNLNLLFLKFILDILYIHHSLPFSIRMA